MPTTEPCFPGENSMRFRLSVCLCVTLLAAGLLGLSPVQSQDKDQKPPRDPDVIYVPTPDEVVDKMLALADVRPGEIVYDLGCGDGRIPVRAAKKYGVKAWGFDINPVRVKESLENVDRH